MHFGLSFVQYKYKFSTYCSSKVLNIVPKSQLNGVIKAIVLCHLIFSYTVGAQIDFPVEGQQLRANMTEDFFMTCSASGIPSPSIFFFRGNESLNDTNGQSGMGMDFTSRVQLGEISMPVLMDDGTLLVTRSLTLTNAVDEDSGNLTCQATNTIIELNETRMDMVMFELIVQGKYEIHFDTILELKNILL